MTIKRNIIWMSLVTTILVAAIGGLSVLSLLNISSSLRTLLLVDLRDIGGADQWESSAGNIAAAVFILMLGTAAGVVLSVGMASFMAMPVASRLQRLRDAAVAVGNGNLDVHVNVGAVDEIGQLAVAFNEMTIRLRRSRDEFEENEANFRQMAEVIRDVFWVSDTSCSKIHYVSPAYEELWGRTRESLYENSLSFVEAIVPEDRARVLSALGEMATLNQEYRIIRPDGTLRWVHARGFPICDETGQILRVVGIATDVTQQKLAEEALGCSQTELEHRVENRTAESKQTNVARMANAIKGDREQMDQNPPFAVDALLDRCMGNAEMVGLILDEFEKQAADNLHDINQNVVSGNGEATARVAHALKGASGILAAGTLSAIALELEQMGTSGSLQQAMPLLSELNEEVLRCIAYLPTARETIVARTVVEQSA